MAPNWPTSKVATLGVVHGASSANANPATWHKTSPSAALCHTATS